MDEDLTIDNLEVNITQVNKTVSDITKLLDKKIDECNSDPDFQHPGLKNRKGYEPIGREKSWPGFTVGAFYWRMHYEPGVEPPTYDTSGFGTIMHYFPNPQKALELLEGMDVVKRKWLKENPSIDISKAIYSTPKVGDLNAGDVVSNDYQIVLDEVFNKFSMLKESRIRDVGEF